MTLRGPCPSADDNLFGGILLIWLFCWFQRGMQGISPLRNPICICFLIMFIVFTILAILVPVIIITTTHVWKVASEGSPELDDLKQSTNSRNVQNVHLWRHCENKAYWDGQKEQRQIRTCTFCHIMLICRTFFRFQHNLTSITELIHRKQGYSNWRHILWWEFVSFVSFVYIWLDMYSEQDQQND